MQKHVKARDAGERICLIVIFYEVCLFLFVLNVISKKHFFSLEVSNAYKWDEALQQCCTVRRLGRQYCLPDPDEQLSENMIKNFSS